MIPCARFSRWRGPGDSVFGATAVRADDMAAANGNNSMENATLRGERNAYTQTNLVSDGTVRARTTDPNC